jgi:hypothetical protein
MSYVSGKLRGMLRLRALALVALLPLAAQAGMLYKSVDANGIVTFSDQPPPSGTKVLDTRVMGNAGYSAPAPAAPAPGAATAIISSGDPMSALVDDPMLAQANARLDQAERELAIARRDLWSAREGLRLVDKRMTLADDARVEFFKRNVATARYALMELLRDRRKQIAANPFQPGDGRPRIIAMSGR